jgi:hypothetical protein
LRKGKALVDSGTAGGRLVYPGPCAEPYEVRSGDPTFPTPEPSRNVKKTLIASVLSLGLFSACLGPNKYWNKLHDWNMSVSENRWANEGIFLVFTIIPVYGITYLADIVIFNSIEWWSKKGEGEM